MAFVALTGAALAHHPEVAVTSVACGPTPGTLTVTYVATAWVGNGDDPSNDPSRANADVRVSVAADTGSFVELGGGAFVAPGYSFGGTLMVNANDRVRVRVRAATAWGNGLGGGETRQTG